MFSAYPDYDGETRTVNIYSLNRHESMLELNFGKNLTGVERKEDAENVVTRLYVAGEYGDNGHVGIDSVNPTGLSFLLNFDYFRNLGVFTPEHENALNTYLRDIGAVKSNLAEKAEALTDLDNQLNELWGQIDYVLYVLNDGVVMRTILGGEAKLEQTEITDTDEITALLSDFTYVEQHGKTFPPGAEYAVKWIRRASAVIGGKEVAIEAKQDLLASLNRQLEKETASEKRQAIIEQISATETAIQELYTGTSGSEGLYALMRRAVLLAVQRANTEGVFQESLCSQQEIEQRFAEAMGDMLRDGYWSNTSYAPGQESLLFLEATEIMET